MSNPSEEHWKAIGKLVGYLKHTREAELILKRPQSLTCYSYSDSDYASDPNDRKSISGRVNSLGGTIVSWQSRKQPLVTLSSTEAEYVSAVACCQEALFVQMLVHELTGQLHKATIYEDNVGAIYLFKNQQVGARTKHIDIRHHFIRNHLEDKRLEIVFVRSEKNHSDLLTKNLPEKLFQFHTRALLKGDLGCRNREDVKGDAIPHHPSVDNPNKNRVTQTSETCRATCVARPQGPQTRVDETCDPPDTFRTSLSTAEEGWTTVSKKKKKNGNRKYPAMSGG